MKFERLLFNQKWRLEGLITSKVKELFCGVRWLFFHCSAINVNKFGPDKNVFFELMFGNSSE